MASLERRPEPETDGPVGREHGSAVGLVAGAQIAALKKAVTDHSLAVGLSRSFGTPWS